MNQMAKAIRIRSQHKLDLNSSKVVPGDIEELGKIITGNSKFALYSHPDKQGISLLQIGTDDGPMSLEIPSLDMLRLGQFLVEQMYPRDEDRLLRKLVSISEKIGR